jgi:hypothetical protein
VRHGLLLGGLSVPEGVLQAIFRTHPYGIDGDSLSDRLHDLGLDPEYVELKRSRESLHQFWERLGHEMDRGAFVLACVDDAMHWITLGKWHNGRIRVVDSYGWEWELRMRSLTPKMFDDLKWQDCVRLVRPGIWQKNYENWRGGRDRLLRLAASAPMVQRLQEAAHVLNDERYAYDRLEFHLSGKSRMVVEVQEPGTQAVSVSTPADGSEGQMVVVRSLAESEPGDPGPPELIFRFPLLCGWQLS